MDLFESVWGVCFPLDNLAEFRGSPLIAIDGSTWHYFYNITKAKLLQGNRFGSHELNSRSRQNSRGS